MYIPCEASTWTLLHQNRKLSSRISLQNQLFCLWRLPAVLCWLYFLKCYKCIEWVQIRCKDINCFGFQSFDIERTWWRLLQKHSELIILDFYVFTIPGSAGGLFPPEDIFITDNSENRIYFSLHDIA